MRVSPSELWRSQSGRGYICHSSGDGFSPAIFDILRLGWSRTGWACRSAVKPLSPQGEKDSKSSWVLKFCLGFYIDRLKKCCRRLYVEISLFRMIAFLKSYDLGYTARLHAGPSPSKKWIVGPSEMTFNGDIPLKLTFLCPWCVIHYEVEKTSPFYMNFNLLFHRVKYTLKIIVRPRGRNMSKSQFFPSFTSFVLGS